MTKFGDASTAISMRHSCTIRASDGAVLCSGNNQVGWVGQTPVSANVLYGALSTTTSQPFAATHPSLTSPPVRLSPTSLPSHTKQHRVQFGQLGTGTTTASNSLVAALAPGSLSGTDILTGATHVAAGGRSEAAAASGHTCACLSSGQAVCWGMNTFGQVS